MNNNFCTLFDSNYLPRGLALYQSLLKNCPHFVLWILCMDEYCYKLLREMKLKNVVLISLNDFEDDNLRSIKGSRSFGEYCWTCTPSLPLYIFKNFPKVEIVSYLDSDLYFYADPEPIFSEMGKRSIMIIPHRFPNEKKWKLKEKQAGIFNVGMLSFKNDVNGRNSLTWWRRKCIQWCYAKVEKGKMGDQKYLDEFPKLFKNVCILKNFGAGLAHWNTKGHQIFSINDKIFVDNSPVIFYHFQGFEFYDFWGLYFSWGPRSIYKNHSGICDTLYKPYAVLYRKMLKNIREYDSNYNLGRAKFNLVDVISSDIIGLIFKVKNVLEKRPIY